MRTGAITVLERGHRLEFAFDALLSYHGGGSPGGVAHAFKVMERAFPLLDQHGPPQRRELIVETAFRGPGARDGFELVTRAVSDGRYHIVPGLERPQRGPTLERFVFRLGYRSRVVTLQVREGFVEEELIALARLESRTAVEEARLERLKQEMAARVMASPASDVLDLEVG